MSRRIPWSYGFLPMGAHLTEVVRHMNQALTDLDQYLRSLHDDISFGPVRGAYFVVPLTRSSDTGALATGAVDLFTFSFEFRPIHVDLICFGGNLTADIESEGSSILSAGSVSLVSGVGQSFNARGDFATDRVTSDLTLHNDSNDSGTPLHIRATVVGKNVSKVEPA